LLFIFKFFLDHSSLSAGKPVNNHLIKLKSLPKSPYPVLSTAFWNSLLIHYYTKPVPVIVFDLVSSKFLPCFLYDKFSDQPPVLLACIEAQMSYVPNPNILGTKSKFHFNNLI